MISCANFTFDTPFFSFLHCLFSQNKEPKKSENNKSLIVKMLIYIIRRLPILKLRSILKWLLREDSSVNANKKHVCYK